MSYIQKRGKNTAWAQGLMRNLTSELIINERLELPEARAKELRKHVDKVITWGKRGDLHARRQAIAYLRNIEDSKQTGVVNKVFTTLAKKYKGRQGGYTRILKLDNRKGDNAPLVLIELV